MDIVFDRYCHVAVSGEKITAEVRRRDLQGAWALVVVSFAYEIFILLASHHIRSGNSSISVGRNSSIGSICGLISVVYTVDSSL